MISCQHSSHLITRIPIGIPATSHVKGPNMARGGVNSLFKNSTKTLEQEVSK